MIHLEGQLLCAECGTRSESGVGWRAYLTVGDEDDENGVRIAVYCPPCAKDLVLAQACGWFD